MKGTNWKKESWTWNIALAIVGKNTPTKAIRNVQLKVVYPLLLVLWVLAVAIGSNTMIYMATTEKPQECIFTQCNHWDVDSWGNYTKEGFYDCDIHGHDCPEND